MDMEILRISGVVNLRFSNFFPVFQCFQNVHVHDCQTLEMYVYFYVDVNWYNAVTIAAIVFSTNVYSLILFIFVLRKSNAKMNFPIL